jgi:oxygen-independent coproporphyrinogen III oxidase
MGPAATRKILLGNSAPVPRYTSYPTAQHFSPRIGSAAYADWLAHLPQHTKLSLYFHIPFCQTLCWYCGCNTKAVRRHEPVTGYLAVLAKEVASVAARVPADHEVAHIHWGGGTPNILSPDDIRQLDTTVRSAFKVAKDVEFGVEIDPRHIEAGQVAAFAAAGVTRVSLGVQDFDPAVQEAISRHQSFEDTKRAADLFRAAGVASVNIDLVYGLPHQTRESVERTIEQVLTLNPDRIAVFGYAHLPARFSHQKMIEDAALPDLVERFGQSQRMARRLAAAGFVRIGLDHYAQPHDPLAAKPLKRNFQGYTTEDAEVLLGFGASAIGQLPQGYVQNAVSTGEYTARINSNGLATVRGLELSPSDRIRAYVIEKLMCDLVFSSSELIYKFGQEALPLSEEADALVDSDREGLVERTADGFRVTERGRPFVRTICACFDAYLNHTPAQYSLAV